MRTLDYRLGFFATLSTTLGVFLAICDLAETPLIFENAKVELASLAPMVVWLVGRRLHLWPTGGI